MAHFIMQIEGLKKVHDRKVVFEDVSLSFYHGAKIGVLGGNGAGKSSLLRIMAGVDRDFDGRLYHHPGAKIGYVAQEPQLDSSKTVREIVEEGVADRVSDVKQYEELTEKLGELDGDAMQEALDKMGALQEKIDASKGWEIGRQLEIAADAMELPPWEMRIADLSGGERRRVALCRTVLSGCDLLLLDEPTNHLDAASVAWLERFLQEFAGTVIAVTHDRFFLDNVAGWILELDRGRGIPWQGNYSSWLEQKQRRMELEGKAREARQKTLARELEWIRLSPRARVAKPKARITAYDRLAAEAMELREETIELQIPPGPKLGTKVLEIAGLRKAYGDNLLIDGLDLSLPAGGIVGVIGPNGAGKTTLFRMIVGAEKPDAGTLELGSSVSLAYVDQTRESLSPDRTAFEEVTDGEEEIPFGTRRINGRAYVSRFGFRGPDQQKLVGVLSGGERNRVLLAKVLRKGGNLLLLDEPTNDLDVDTLRVLEEALLAFNGCAVVISHDRWFLDRIATHILAFEGEGKVRWFEGNHQAYAEKRKQELGKGADQPHRIRYKKLAT
ncbi:MAG TPA: energy-dependent translational throttle protein EttA [Planctomycetota bacterium]|nr:energy-dependent translational throttle protein EttA [Planctomycetota bacterium]